MSHAAGETVAFNPATGERLGSIPNIPLDAIPQIFAQARAAQRIWGAKSFAERRKHIEGMRRYIVDHADQIARIVSQGNGKTPDNPAAGSSAFMSMSRSISPSWRFWRRRSRRCGMVPPVLVARSTSVP